ncbi:MAG: MBL fold metallo-hydrolase [Desulfobacteraceae bacterium]|nr:MBL fold metallo-hydrolase [Desulfobacteraceae bacterium]
MKTKIITVEHKINFLVTVNIFILADKKVVIVDTGVRDSYKLVLKKLEEHNIDKEQVSLILVTHAHPDHCLGIANMKKIFKAPIAVSRLEAPFLTCGEFSPVVPLNYLGKIVFGLLKSLHKKHEDYIYPDIVFDDELDLERFGIKGKALLTPGHSIGGSSVVLEDGNCIIGDLIIEDVLTKNPRINLFAVDKKKLKRSLKRIINNEVEKVYTSHGKAWNRKKYQRKIEKLIA